MALLPTTLLNALANAVVVRRQEQIADDSPFDQALVEARSNTFRFFRIKLRYFLQKMAEQELGQSGFLSKIKAKFFNFVLRHEFAERCVNFFTDPEHPSLISRLNRAKDALNELNDKSNQFVVSCE